MDVLRRILWQRLDAELTRAVGSGWREKKFALYGAGGMGSSFLRMFPQIRPSMIVDGDVAREGSAYHGLTILSPESLAEEDPDEILVFITSSWHEEIRITLESLGLTLNQNFFYGTQQAHGRIFFYLKEMSDFKNAFAWFDERGVTYSLLRWFESLPDDVPEDIHLLTETTDLRSFFDNPYLRSDPGGVQLEVYWSQPLGQEDELLSYPTWLAQSIFESRQKLACGVYAPSPDLYLKSLAFHVVFHKAEGSRLPVEAGEATSSRSNKYREKLGELAAALGLRISLTLEGLWTYLEAVEWLPPVDLARRYASESKSPWLTSKVRSANDCADNILVFVLREWLDDRSEIFDSVVHEIESFGLERVSILELNAAEKKRAYEQIRGGNWIETEESRIGGGPSTFAVFCDPSPELPSAQDRLLRPFCSNRKLAGKTELKQRICRQFNDGEIVNFLHAADDEIEGYEYIDCLGDERRNSLLLEIEAVTNGLDARVTMGGQT